MSVGKRLKEERTRLKISQSELARVGGISKRTQINYESNKHAPNINYLAAVEKLIDIQYVITGIRKDKNSDNNHKQHITNIDNNN